MDIFFNRHLKYLAQSYKHTSSLRNTSSVYADFQSWKQGYIKATAIQNNRQINWSLCWVKTVFLSCSIDHKDNESVTERDAGEDSVGAGPLWAGLPLQSGVRGRGSASLLSGWQRSRWNPPGVKGLSGLLGMLCAGHCTESHHSTDQRRPGQHHLWHHPHPCSCHDHIRLPLPLHGNNLLWKSFIFLFVKWLTEIGDYPDLIDQTGAVARFLWAQGPGKSGYHWKNKGSVRTWGIITIHFGG